jgi:lambda family phage tail tape measure protein
VEAGFERGFIKAQENLNDFASLSEKIVVDSFQGMEDAAVNFAKTGKLEVGSLVDSILADFVRLQIRQSFANALGSSGGKDGGSGILGLVGGLFSSSSNPNGPPGTSGGSATSGSGSTFANLASLAGSLFASNQEGGIERQPTISTLAEKGPEAIIPLKGGSVPVEIKESLKPPINITNVFNISTPDVQGFGRSTGQVGSMMGTAMQSALARNS